jgi:hypothetical protein
MATTIFSAPVPTRLPMAQEPLYPTFGVSKLQQPSSPTQCCVVGNATINIQDANDTGITVSCAEYSYVTNAADNTLSAYTLDATTGALGRQRHESSGE